MSPATNTPQPARCGARPQHSAPNLRHHKASGRAFVELTRGRYTYLGKYGAPETDIAYRRLLAELAENGKQTTNAHESTRSHSKWALANIIATQFQIIEECCNIFNPGSNAWCPNCKSFVHWCPEHCEFCGYTDTILLRTLKP